MRLIRNKQLERYEQLKGVYDYRIPDNHYEIFIRGCIDGETWCCCDHFEKCEIVDNFVEEIVKGNLSQELLDTFLNEYSSQYNTLPTDYDLYVMGKFKVFVTYKDKYIYNVEE